MVIVCMSRYLVDKKKTFVPDLDVRNANFLNIPIVRLIFLVRIIDSRP